MFIAIEGIDGCGKTTLAKKLASKIDSGVLTSEPAIEYICGKELHKFLRGELGIAPLEQALMFAANRASHTVSKILPSLGEGYNVICDRYLMSSLAYQKSVGFAKVYSINIGHIKPDITLFIDTSINICVERINKRISIDVLENDLYKVWIAYLDALEYLKQKGWKIVRLNGNVSKEELLNRALWWIDEIQNQ